MQIVILDGHTTNPGDLDWKPLEQLGDLTVYPRTAEAEIVQRIGSAEVVFTNKTPLSRATLAQLPRVRYIGVLATGYNVVDVEAARERQLPVCNVPEYGTPNVAQAVFALLLELTNRVGHHAATVREGRWSQCPDFCYWDGQQVELAGRTFGIFGYGRIGAAVARIALAFGMRVVAHKRTPDPTAEGVEWVSREQLFAQSDVLSLHAPLTAETKEIIRAETLRQMKPSAFLINTGRGALVQEADLAHALNSRQLAGAGLDVLSTEPPPASNPLLTARNCLITPHIAWATLEARRRLVAVAAENLAAWQAGRPQNVVNLPAA